MSTSDGSLGQVGDGARAAIIEATWAERDSLDASQLVAGMSLRRIADAAGVSPGTVRYHFPTMRDLGLAMADSLLAGMSLLPIEETAEGLALLGTEGIATAARTAAQTNWELLSVPDEREFEGRVRRLVDVAIGAGPDAEAMRRKLRDGYWGAFRSDVDAMLQITIAAAGRGTVDPFTVRDLSIITGALSLALMAEDICQPGEVRPDLYADAVVALVRGSTIPVTQSRSIGEIAAEMHADLPGDRSGRSAYIALAQAAAPSFDDGFDDVGFAAVLEVAGSGLAVESVVEAFGTVRTLAAASFSRHVDDIAEASTRRRDGSPEVALSDVVHEIARRAQAEPWVVLALLQERAEASVRSGDVVGPDDIRALVPLDALVDEALGLDRPDLSDRDRSSLARILVDATLAQAASRPDGALTPITARIVALAGSGRAGC
ncbi:MAG: TetR family transcriptional regulator [Actinobacteria bacterium]|nr:TetR family transcriptional regulator [Actinomycetota bacterium]